MADESSNARGSEPVLRRFVRKPVVAEVHGKEETVVGHLFFDSQDLSLGGAFLRADLLLEVDEELEVILKLPGGRSFEARARVAWVRRSEGAGGMGIEFTRLHEADRRELAAFLSRV
jgi:uncharacterized protein (TIGR02266 family)